MPTLRPTSAKTPQAPARKPAAKKPAVVPAKKPTASPDQLAVAKKPAPKSPAPKPAAPPPPPKPVVAESREQAIALALEGKAVLIPLEKLEPREFALKAIGEEGGIRRFEARFGPESFNIALADGHALEPGLAHAFQMIAQIPDDLRKGILAVTVLDPRSESAHYKIAMADLGGAPDTVTIQRTGVVDGKAVFAISIRQHTLEFKAPVENDLAWGTSRAGSLYAQIPEHLRHVLKTVVVDNGPNPLDEYWSKTYNMPNFSSAASASNGTAYFWNGHRNLWDDTFHHEFGHLMGQLFSTQNNYVPDDWADAAKADGGEVTNYAKASADEDFAECWWVYLRLKNNKPAYFARMTSLEDFQTKFPNRTKILEAIYNGERKPAERPAPATAAPLAHLHDEAA